MNCSQCEYCREIGRQAMQRGRFGRKKYYCENPKIHNMKDEHGYPLNNFIGFGDMTFESSLTLKTSKKWCPLKGEKR